MVKIETALEIIYNSVKKKSSEIIPIEQSIGLVTAREYKAVFDLPRFNNSAMDGYAIKLCNMGEVVRIKNSIYAGNISNELLKEGESIKIMTGAPIPQGCEAIVPIEDIELVGENSIKVPLNVKPNAMIRWKGEDIKSGKPFLKIGKKIGGYTIALLASQGITHIEVYRKPKVVIFSTGEELKAHYERIEPHQLYNSNALMFYARTLELGCDVSYISTSGDTLSELKLSIQNAKDADLIITSGGVSVGDKDFTLQAFREMGMEILFSKVDIKPGRPTTFGKLDNSFVVNLAGNPLASMVNFEMFVKPIILILSGTDSIYHPIITTKIRENYQFKGGRYSVILGEWNGDTFAPLDNQKSGMIAPLDKADGMVVVTPNINFLKRNQIVKMIPIKSDMWNDKNIDFYIR